MIINQASISAIFKGFNTRFNKVLKETPVTINQIATTLPSLTSSEQYGWLQQLPGMKEWLNDKVLKSIATNEFTIKNRRWEDTIEVDKDVIEDDRVGIYDPLVSMLAEAAAQHPQSLVYDLLNAGFAATLGLAYDGQFFFDTDHPDGLGGTYSNKGTAVFDAAGTAFEAAVLSMRTRKGEEGRYLQTRGNLLVGPPSLESAFNQVIKARTLASGADNVNFGRADVLIVNELEANPTQWYLLDTTKAIKPFIFQLRKKVKPVSMTGQDTETVFMRGKLLYGAEARYNAGYGLPQLAYGSTGTV